MKKWRWAMWSAVPVAGLCGFAWLSTRPTGPECAIGFSRYPIRWISLHDAQRKPFLDFIAPGGTKIQFPAKVIDAKGDDPRMVAGYLLIEGAMARLEAKDEPGDGMSSHQQVMNGPYILPIYYAAKESTRERYLTIGRHERVKITVPYDPNKIPARLSEAAFSVGPYKMVCDVRHFEKDAVIFHGVIDKRDYTTATLQTVRHSGRQMTTRTNQGWFHLGGTLDASDTIQLKGTLKVEREGKTETYPVSSSIPVGK